MHLYGISRGGLCQVLGLYIVMWNTLSSVYCDEDSEERDNQIDVGIYQLGLTTWTDDVKSPFESLVLNAVNSRCAENPTYCGLTTFDAATWNFSSSDIDYLDPLTYKKPYLNVTFAVKYPGAASGDLIGTTFNYYLPKTTLIASIESIRVRFHENSAYSILTIDKTPYNLPPDNMMNIIMITITCIAVLICLLAGVILEKMYGGPPEAVQKDSDSKGSNKNMMELTEVETVKNKPVNGADTQTPTAK